MKKYVALLLAVMLVGTSSCAYARVRLSLSVFTNGLRVGNDAKKDANASIRASVSGFMADNYYFQLIGNLPPDCELEQDGSDEAYIKGKLTKEGNYSFSVRVDVIGETLNHIQVQDSGSDSFTMNILPARDITPDSQDIPAPEPDPSKDIPAPVPNPKPQAVGVIANKLGLSSADVEYVASSDMKAVQPPTASITNALSSDGREIISTQGSITAQKTGYYVFPLTVPADLVGTNTELKVYLADRNIFSGASFRPSALPAGITEAQIFTESGGTVTTLPGNILVAANLQANTATTFSTHITKARSDDSKGVSSSGGGGCDSFPLISALILSALTAITKSRH